MVQVCDPVCCMEVDPDSALWVKEVSGETYWFCSRICKETFERNLDGLQELERLRMKRESDRQR